jgi:hypothetical protein
MKSSRGEDDDGISNATLMQSQLNKALMFLERTKLRENSKSMRSSHFPNRNDARHPKPPSWSSMLAKTNVRDHAKCSTFLKVFTNAKPS